MPSLEALYPRAMLPALSIAMELVQRWMLCRHARVWRSRCSFLKKYPGPRADGAAAQLVPADTNEARAIGIDRVAKEQRLVIAAETVVRLTIIHGWSVLLMLAASPLLVS